MIITIKNHQKHAMVLVENAMGIKLHPCWTQLAIRNHIQCLRDAKSLLPSAESSLAVSNGDMLAIRYIINDTTKPLTSIIHHTDDENGVRNENKSCDLDCSSET